MRYSLIVPHYNDIERLERLLRTVPIAREDIEVLVVDDCSSDQKALDHAKRRWPSVRWASTLQNAGAGAARNIGLELAKGERLVFCDSDDEFLPSAFELFDEHEKGDADLTYYLAESVQEVDGSQSNRAEWVNDLCMSFLNKPTRSRLMRLKLGHVVPWAKVYSREHIERCGIRFEEIRVSNDVAFNILAAIHAKNIFVAPVSVYRVHRRPRSLTADPSPDAFLERVLVKVRLATKLKDMGVREGLSATGFMLSSFSYGPSVVIKTWKLCIGSDMKINLIRLLEYERWIRFIKKKRVDGAEKRAAISDGNAA